MSNQLVKRDYSEGYRKVFPKTFIDAIKDRDSGMSLAEILQSFNMYFLSYNGNKALTRCSIPHSLRKEGLWITYVLYDHTVITEWYNSDNIDDESFGSDDNWRQASNMLVGDISVSADGYWIIEGKKTNTKAQGETGITPLLRFGDNNKLQASYNEGKEWEDISGDITNNLKISKYIGINEALPTSGIAEGTIYMKGPYYDENDTNNDNPIYRMWVYAWKGNTLAWQDNGEFTSISAGVIQETGNSTTQVMSQDAVTRELAELSEEVLDIRYTSGGVLGQTGEFIKVDGYAYSDLIPVDTPNNYTFNFGAIDRTCYVLEYDSELNCVDYWSLRTAETTRTLNITAKATYIRFSFKLANLQIVNVMKDGVIIWLPSSNKIDDLKDDFYPFMASQEVSESALYKFEYGTIGGDLKFYPANAMLRSRVALMPGVNTLSLTIPNCKVFRMVIENSEGVLRLGTITDRIKGNADNAAVWIMVERNDEQPIADYTKDACSVLVQFPSTNPNVSDSIQLEVEKNKDSLSANMNELASLDHDRDIDTRKLIDKIKSMEKSLAGLYRAGTAEDTQTIELPHDKGGKFLLNLHRTQNNGYVTKNNAYLPNANKDFSDVCVMANGEPLAMHKIFSGNIDILPDDRLLPMKSSLVRTSSEGIVFGSNGEGVYRSSDSYTWEKIAIFNDLIGASVCFVDSQDNLFVSSQGRLYKSSAPYITKKLVLDVRQNHDDAIINTDTFVEHPTTHRLFTASYQKDYDIHILSSDDFGETWQTRYRSLDTYQHIHMLKIDIYTSAIYAGCDAGGGILKSTDNGNTWVDLRALNPSIPQATDYGIVYCDESGYRLTAGETTIVGGFTTLKTTDDFNFRPVLALGKPVYFIEKLNGVLVGNTISSSQASSTGFVVSYDDGETWQTAMTTAPLFENGASDGYKFMAKYKDHLLCGLQSSAMNLSPVRIYCGGDHYYAQMIVEVPMGVSSLVVESGHFASKIEPIYNNYESADPILHLPFNSNLIEGMPSPYLTRIEGGRKISEITPSILSPEDKFATSIAAGFYYELKGVDLSNKDFHIGLWYKAPSEPFKDYDNFRRIDLISAKLIPNRSYRLSGISIEANFRLIIGNDSVSIDDLYPGVYGGAWMRLDLNVKANGEIDFIVNGRPPQTIKVTDNVMQYFTEDNILVLNIPSIPSENFNIPNAGMVGIQHFEITEGNITQEEAIKNFYANIYDVY